eukprot:XP_019918138.1 PREDICTED: E3 ubiquitin/ISG15 ligase TRIM25-like [Crassostrea gigas]
MAQPQMHSTIQNPTFSGFKCQYCNRYQQYPSGTTTVSSLGQVCPSNPTLQSERKVKKTIMILDPNTGRDITSEVLNVRDGRYEYEIPITSPKPNGHGSQTIKTIDTGSSGSCTENSNDRRQRMSLLLSCIICKEKLRNPISFLCFHSICKKCFEGIIRQQQSENCKSRGDIMLRCPSCDYQTSLYVIKLKKDEPSHLYIKQVIQSLCDFEYGINSPVCISCKKRGKMTTSSFWCFDCVDHYCDECLAFHSSFPQLDKHKTYSLNDIKKKHSLFTKAREICEKHKSRFTKLCIIQGKVCCDSCISSDHIDICLGEHIELQQIRISMIVNSRVSELRLSIQKLSQELSTKEKELSGIEIETEKFFHKEQSRADEKCHTLKKKMLESTDSFLAESFKNSTYKLEEKQSRSTSLKQQRLILENAVGVMSALRSGSDIRVFLETKKVTHVLKNAEALLHAKEEETIKTLSISFKRTLNRFCFLNSFGNITETQLTSNQDNLLRVRRDQGSQVATHKISFVNKTSC